MPRSASCVWVLNYYNREDHEHWIYTTEEQAEQAAVNIRRQRMSPAFKDLIKPILRLRYEVETCIGHKDTMRHFVEPNEKSDITFDDFQQPFTRPYTIRAGESVMGLSASDDHKRMIDAISALRQMGPEHLSSELINWLFSLYARDGLDIFVERLSLNNMQPKID